LKYEEKKQDGGELPFKSFFPEGKEEEKVRMGETDKDY